MSAAQSADFDPMYFIMRRAQARRFCDQRVAAPFGAVARRNQPGR